VRLEGVCPEFDFRTELTCVRCKGFGGTHTDGADSLDVAALRDLGQHTNCNGQLEKAAIQRPQPLSTHSTE